MGLITIGTTAAAIFLIAGILGLVSPKVRSFYQVIPLFKSHITAIILVAIGLIFGGVAGVEGMFTGASTNPVNLDEQSVAGVLECVYVSGTAINGTSYKRDSDQFNSVNVEISSNETTGNEINMTFECDLENTDVSKVREVEILAKGQTFQSEVDAYDVREYNILDTTTTTSRFFSPEKEQVIYLAEGSEATSSDSVERLKLTFAEGSSTATFSILGDVSQLALSHMEESSSKALKLTSDGSEVAVVNFAKDFE